MVQFSGGYQLQLKYGLWSVFSLVRHLNIHWFVPEVLQGCFSPPHIVANVCLFVCLLVCVFACVFVCVFACMCVFQAHPVNLMPRHIVSVHACGGVSETVGDSGSRCMWPSWRTGRTWVTTMTSFTWPASTHIEVQVQYALWSCRNATLVQYMPLHHTGAIHATSSQDVLPILVPYKLEADLTVIGHMHI